MIELKKYIKQIRKNLDEELQVKTSFGRNELKLIFEQVLTNSLVEVVNSKNLIEGTVLKKRVRVTDTKVYTKALSSRPRKRSQR